MDPSRFLIGLCILMGAVPTSASAQILHIPTTLVYADISGGWRTGDTTGFYRVLVFTRTDDHTVSELYVEWLGSDIPEGQPTPVLATVRLPGITELGWQAFRPSFVHDNGGTVLIVPMGNSHEFPPLIQTCRYRLGGPGRYEQSCTHK